MGIMRWAEDKLHGLSLGDFVVVKVALVLFGIIIGAYISAFVQQYVWYLTGLFVVLYLYLMIKIFRK
ncbi:MAG: hypothetical protein GXP63_03655 [DPANN group archaeon]|nr:hypothetical protein [DPANN group archaeon]